MSQPSQAVQAGNLPEGGDAFRADGRVRRDNRNGHRSDRRGVSRSFSKGSLLFLEGEPAHDVFILRRGCVTLSISSPMGKSVILGVAGQGDIIGLGATVACKEYEATAEALEDCDVEVVTRASLVGELMEGSDVALRAVRQLSDSYLHTCEMLSSFANADPVLLRLAKLFVSWLPGGVTAIPQSI